MARGAPAPGTFGHYNGSAPIGVTLDPSKKGPRARPASFLRDKRLRSGHLHNLDHVDHRSRHLREGPILSEYSRHPVRRLRLDNGIAAHVVFGVLDPLCVYAFGPGDQGPRSASEALLYSIHFIHAFVPFFRCSGVEFFIISGIPEASAMY
jgi:hypothetical protein